MLAETLWIDYSSSRAGGSLSQKTNILTIGFEDCVSWADVLKFGLWVKGVALFDLEHGSSAKCLAWGGYYSLIQFKHIRSKQSLCFGLEGGF